MKIGAWVIRQPCELCEGGSHISACAYREGAEFPGLQPGFVPWGTEKAARRALKDFEGAGYNVEGWEVEEVAD